MSVKKFSTQIDEAVLKDLKEYASSSDHSISKIVTDAVAEYLQKIKVRPVFRNAMDEVIEENKDLLERLAK